MNGVRIDSIADTSAIIGLSRRDPRTIAAVRGHEFGISCVTVAELALGILKANNKGAAVARLEAVLGNRRGQTLYPTDMDAARLRGDLPRTGTEGNQDSKQRYLDRCR